MGTPLSRFRIVSLLEGLSFLLLLAIAMPLKYWLAIPMAVTIIGSLHGLLFCLYLIVLLHVMIAHRWSIWKGFLAFVAAIIPFGPFIFDKKMLAK